jgi:3-oxoacyl-[acyl-carrier-protein] synthase-3
VPFLRAFGAMTPARVVPNAEIAERIGKTPEWILDVSGIEERRWAPPETSVADLALCAASSCLNRAGIPASAVGMLILASGSAEWRFPGPAAEVAHRLGLEGAPALDLPAASAGSLLGLAIAARMAGLYREILVIGAEKMSAVLESAPLDPNTAMLFGDGAGACLVSADTGEWSIVDTVLHSDGAFSEALRLPLSGPLAMDGMTVILQASRKIPGAITELLRRNRREAARIGHFVLHQANHNLTVRVARALGVPQSRFVSNIRRYGNTSSASMLLAAAEADLSGESLCLAAFGAGFHWGAMLADRRPPEDPV